MIAKVIFVAIICIFTSSLLKKYNAEFASMVNVCGGVIIFLICVDGVAEMLNSFKEIYSFSGLDFNFLKIIFKIIGVGYITEFTADIAEDFGNNIISSKVVLGGKIVICGMALPIIKDLLAILFSFLS